MFKILILTMGVSLVPTAQQISIPLFVANNSNYNFQYKNSIKTNPFEDEKKPTETWNRNWMAAAQENIRKSEYQFTWEDKYNAYCTPNRKNNLRFFYNEMGFSVEPRTTKIPLDNYESTVPKEKKIYRYLPSWKVHFALDKKQVGDGTWRVNENTAAYVTENITVQYINDDEGMRQNFIVYAPLTDNDLLTINLKIKTKLTVTNIGDQLKFFYRNTHVLNYEKLRVWDARGKLLQASFIKIKHNRYGIQVVTKDALYPITIDPLSTVPDNTPDDADQADANFGNTVSSAGDVNGDGYSDVIIGAYLFDDGANNDEGRAFVYYGSAAGLPASPDYIADDANQADAQFGVSVANAGDVNGDGYSDIIIGAHLYDDPPYTNEGRAFVYHGSAGGLSTVPNSEPDDADQDVALFGKSVACAGDVNGDGYSDVIIGAYFYDDGAFNDEGRAYVYFGGLSGISTSPDNILDDANQAGARFGVSVASAGDVNGDGFSDVIVGAYLYNDGANTAEGRAFVYHGSIAGLSATPDNTPDDADQAVALFGISVASAGDINGDGYSDVIIGAYYFDDGGNTNEGRAFVYLGSATGLPASPDFIPDDADQAGAQFGVSVACAGDVNGDGYSDVIIGANHYDDGLNTEEGKAFVYYGSGTGLAATPNSSLDDADQAGAQFGVSVASAGDINGDGYSDVIIGAWRFDDGLNTDEGKAFVYHGSAAGLSSMPNNTLKDANQAGANFGVSVAGAGDINGDGFDDVIIGAWLFDDGANVNEGRAFVYHGSATGLSPIPNSTPDDADQPGAFFGETVACAGDVNGDGYSDIIIGADNYDDGPNSNEGRAFVYHGSAAGLSSVPNSMPDDGDQANIYFGVDVACAGDVNGDGYSDVIIGAIGYQDGANVNEGRAFVYYGSSTGLSDTPNSTPDDADQAGAFFGWSVAGAGDVNGDGYSDVIIGAPTFDDGGNADEGRAFIYHGSAAGLSNSPNNMPDDANQTAARFGESVSGAGDVNGDGYSDVIIGARLFDDGANTDEGRAFVYYGSAIGLSALPDNTPDDADQTGASFGISVACAGDVNGDGYSDIIIGARLYDDGGNTDEGRAYVYHGSATGLPASPNSIYHDANQAFAYFGYSVSGAGDINGDGFSDVLIGAHSFDDGASANEGAAFLYLGNESVTNLHNNLRLYNIDLNTPISNSNFILGNFGAGLFAKSFLSRAKGKLVWETRLNYNAYSGTPITNSTFFTAEQATYTDLGLTGTEVKNLVDKVLGGNYTKLRARVKYDPVTAITGQVYSPWRNVSSIIDGNNLGALPVELISFKAAWLQKGRTARLDFKTDKEAGICCFDIEKSIDGFNFYTIGTITAKNTSSMQSYSFIDGNATGKNQYYRLRIKGIGGKTELSNIQQLQHDKATEILVFPNPTTDILQLQLNKVYDKMNLQIVNSNGQVVKQLTIAASNQTLSIPVQNLAPGQYWLRLQSGDDNQVLQFVKQ